MERLRRAALALAVLCGAWIAAAPILSATSPDTSEVRALWVTRSSMTSPASIATLVKTAHDQGFNTLLVQVRGRADAYYLTDLEPRPADLARQPAGFDPLASVLAQAKVQGIHVHAWLALNLVSSAVDLPSAPDHLVYRHPEWLMVPRPIAQEIARLDPSNPGYVGKIARWTRGQLEAVEGLYASPLQPEAAAYTERVVADLARRYDLDGIHLDYARYPNQQFDYSRFAIAEFRADIRPRIALDTRRQLDAEAADLAGGADPAGGARRAPERAAHRGRVSRPAGCVRRSSPGLARLACRPPGGRRRADGLHAGAGSVRGTDRRGARCRRRPRRMGGHRILQAHAGPDDRQHPGGAQAGRRRVRAVLVRQSDRSKIAGARLPGDREPRGLRPRAFN
jgi:hypothetical protein